MVKPVRTAAEFAARFPVSRETLERLETFVGLLLKWQASINLVARSSLDEIWQRHVLDSAQLFPLMPQEATLLVDLGSGGGFPGIVLAILLRDRPGAVVHLVESDQRKCAFLREAARLTGAPVKVHAERIEKFTGHFSEGPADVVTARALAPLKELLDWSFPLFGPETIGLFMKGEGVGHELTEASKYWTLKSVEAQSLSDPSGTILTVKGLGREPS